MHVYVHVHACVLTSLGSEAGHLLHSLHCRFFVITSATHRCTHIHTHTLAYSICLGSEGSHLNAQLAFPVYCPYFSNTQVYTHTYTHAHVLTCLGSEGGHLNAQLAFPIYCHYFSNTQVYTHTNTHARVLTCLGSMGGRLLQSLHCQFFVVILATHLTAIHRCTHTYTHPRVLTCLGSGGGHLLQSLGSAALRVYPHRESQGRQSAA